MAGLDSNTKLLLHCNGTNGSQSFPDVSDSEHTVTAEGTAQVDTSEKKFGTGSCFFDGNSDYLTIPDSSDWDVISSNTKDYTIDLWVKHDDHDGYEHYITQRPESNVWWTLRHVGGSGLNFKAYDINGIKVVLDTGYGGEITDTNWHHVAVVIKGETTTKSIGIYLDGVQVVYTQDSDTLNLSAHLVIGANAVVGGAIDSYFDGYMDEIRFQNSNYFNASPNSGKTDTITVPTNEYSKSTGFKLKSQPIIIG